jgi:type IV fimbrial biogenesis protein FimT
MLKNSGFTLIELLITLVIVAVLTMTAIPSFKHILQANKSTAVINHVVGVTRLARNTAVTEKTTTTLCPSIDGVTCSNEWEGGVILFTDNNTNSQVDGDDHVVRFYQPFIDSGFLNWRSLRNKIQFSSTGIPRGTVGSFVYCPNNQNPLYAKTMILSFQGRIRSGQDRNQDGIAETGSGQNISCS